MIIGDNITVTTIPETFFSISFAFISVTFYFVLVTIVLHSFDDCFKSKS